MCPILYHVATALDLISIGSYMSLRGEDIDKLHSSATKAKIGEKLIKDLSVGDLVNVCEAGTESCQSLSSRDGIPNALGVLSNNLIGKCYKWLQQAHPSLVLVDNNAIGECSRFFLSSITD